MNETRCERCQDRPAETGTKLCAWCWDDFQRHITLDNNGADTAVVTVHVTMVIRDDTSLALGRTCVRCYRMEGTAKIVKVLDRLMLLCTECVHELTVIAH